MNGIVYSWKLVNIDPLHPLFEIEYIGQSVGSRATDDLLKRRCMAHTSLAYRCPKQTGLHAAIRMFGRSAFFCRVLEKKSGDAVEVQNWINAREIHHIAARGGVLKSMSVRCHQTLNLAPGGKGDALCFLASLDARCNAAWENAQRALLSLIEHEGTTDVPSNFVNEFTGHKTGSLIVNLRQGVMLNNHKDEHWRRYWLEDLPGWTWNAEYRQSDLAWEEAKTSLLNAVDDLGHIQLPSNYRHPVTGVRTRSLVDRIRRGEHLRDNKKQERIAWLHSLPGWSFNPRDDAWETSKRELRLIVQLTGTTKHPKSYVNQRNKFKIGTRIHNLKMGRQLKNKVDEVERRRWLESLPGWEWFKSA